MQVNVSEFLSIHGNPNAPPPAHAMLLTYEDLLREPGEATRTICSLVDVPWADAMANPYDDAQAVASFTPAKFVATTDVKLLRRKAIDPSKADKWREVVLPQPLLSETVAIALQLGYEMPGAAGYGLADLMPTAEEEEATP